MKVQFTATSRRRLRQIRDYYNDKGNAKKGRKVTKAVLKQSKLLETTPYLG